MDDLKRQKAVIAEMVFSLGEEKRELISAIRISKDSLEGLITEENTRTKHIGELSVEEDRLLTTISVLENDLRKKRKDIDTLDHEYNTRHERYIKELRILEIKQQDISKEVMTSIDEIKDAQIELANRQKQLDDRDKNLRIRESKVEQGEKYIVKNYNLLNL